MVLFALEKIYPLRTKQVVYRCKAKACTASAIHSNDEGTPVLPSAPGDMHKGCNVLLVQEHIMQIY